MLSSVLWNSIRAKGVIVWGGGFVMHKKEVEMLRIKFKYDFNKVKISRIKISLLVHQIQERERLTAM